MLLDKLPQLTLPGRRDGLDDLKGSLSTSAIVQNLCPGTGITNWLRLEESFKLIQFHPKAPSPVQHGLEHLQGWGIADFCLEGSLHPLPQHRSLSYIYIYFTLSWGESLGSSLLEGSSLCGADHGHSSLSAHTGTQLEVLLCEGITRFL